MLVLGVKNTVYTWLRWSAPTRLFSPSGPALPRVAPLPPHRLSNRKRMLVLDREARLKGQRAQS
eukprot:scaffold116948_cov27-Tisochrysis_lutea.AAC.1